MQIDGIFMKKAQAGIEFMIMLVAMMAAFALAYAIYSDLAQNAETQRDAMEANAICLRVSSVLGSLSTLPGNSSYGFDLPSKLNGKNYTVMVASAYRLVKVEYGTSGMGCHMQLANITNSTGARSFVLSMNATVSSNGGNLIVRT